MITIIIIIINIGLKYRDEEKNAFYAISDFPCPLCSSLQGLNHPTHVLSIFFFFKLFGLDFTTILIDKFWLENFIKN